MCIHTYIHAYMHTHTHTHTHTCIPYDTPMRKDTQHSHAYTHARLHTRTTEGIVLVIAVTTCDCSYSLSPSKITYMIRIRTG